MTKPTIKTKTGAATRPAGGKRLVKSPAPSAQARIEGELETRILRALT